MPTSRVWLIQLCVKLGYLSQFWMSVNLDLKWAESVDQVYGGKNCSVKLPFTFILFHRAFLPDAPFSDGGQPRGHWGSGKTLQGAHCLCKIQPTSWIQPRYRPFLELFRLLPWFACYFGLQPASHQIKSNWLSWGCFPCCNDDSKNICNFSFSF